MEDINSKKAGMSLGLLFAAMHTIWVALVGIGSGQSIVNLIHSAHFIEMTATVTSLNLTTALLGIFGAFVSGYIIGIAFAFIWNKLK